MVEVPLAVADRVLRCQSGTEGNYMNIEPVAGGLLRDSTVVRVAVEDWPNDYRFHFFRESIGDWYLLSVSRVVQLHFSRTGIGHLASCAIPVDNVYEVDSGADFDFWANKIAKFRGEADFDGGNFSVLQIDSPLFGSRRNRLFDSGEHSGILIVCRAYTIEPASPPS